MVDLKELGEGVSLGGLYTLEYPIRHDSTGTLFAALTGDGGRLLIKLVSEQDPESEQQFATWQRSRQLRHAHLLDVRDVGRGEVAGNNYIYGVFECPDDFLAQALEQGPLSEPETRGVLEAALAALRYLHGQGLVHGAVDPGHIVAVGETVKLATDGLRESADLEGHPEDVRQLGELVRTLRAPEPLSEPLATIVRHAADKDAAQRWTLAEIARVLEPPPPVPAVAPAIPAPVTPAVPAAVSPVPPPVPARVPVVRHEPDARPPQALPDPPRALPNPPRAFPNPPRAFPKWILAGLAILLLSILIFNLRSKPEAAQPTPEAAAPFEPLAPPPVTAPPPPATTMWRVIAFTYGSRDMAARKAKQINNRWPDLRAAVFTPKGLRGYYLVALGDGMKREAATRLQRRALSLGLPRDTYVQNYSE